MPNAAPNMEAVIYVCTHTFLFVLVQVWHVRYQVQVYTL